MHFVKQFNIKGVDTKQVACIELQGAPNAATEGAIGVLGIDVTSPTHDIYKCVEANGAIYTWELLSSGMSIISSTETGEGGAKKSFAYTSLLIPNKYVVKVGDLILDSGGYLYQISALSSSSCDATYCGISFGGGSGGSGGSLVVTDGKLQLVTPGGNVISSVDYLLPDNSTLFRDSDTGKAVVMSVKTVNESLIHFFVGTLAEYEKLTDIQKENLFAIITDDTTTEDVLASIRVLENWKTSVTDGTVAVPKANVLSKWFTNVPFRVNVYVDMELDVNSVYLIDFVKPLFLILHSHNDSCTTERVCWMNSVYAEITYNITNKQGILHFYNSPDGDTLHETYTNNTTHIPMMKIVGDKI